MKVGERKRLREAEEFEANIAKLKDRLGVNIELAAPDQFIPALPDWQGRSLFIGRFGKLDFYHYDPYSQALAKLERGHPRDLEDVDSMFRDGLIKSDRLQEFFEAIRGDLIRYPSIEQSAFAESVADCCANHP